MATHSGKAGGGGGGTLSLAGRKKRVMLSLSKKAAGLSLTGWE